MVYLGSPLLFHMVFFVLLRQLWRHNRGCCLGYSRPHRHGLFLWLHFVFYFLFAHSSKVIIHTLFFLLYNLRLFFWCIFFRKAWFCLDFTRALEFVSFDGCLLSKARQHWCSILSAHHHRGRFNNHFYVARSWIIRVGCFLITTCRHIVFILVKLIYK